MLKTSAALCAAVVGLGLGDSTVFCASAQAGQNNASALGWDISAAQKGGGARFVAPRTSIKVNTVRTTTRVRTNVVRTTTPRFKQVKSVSPKIQKLNTSNTISPSTLKSLKSGPKIGPVVGPVTPTVKLLNGPGKINIGGPKPNVPFIKLANNKVAPIFKGPKKIWWGGGWKTFLPYSALGVFLIGGSYFYADGYLSLAGPYCAGITPDGCRLRWQLVGFEGGGEDWQCVQFCPRPGAMPPPTAVAFTDPPPVPQGRCEVVIYPDPTFGGNAVPTSDQQPRLSESGWQNQIASIQVRAGTWDFFAGEEFTGESMRLQPGPYPDLGPEWSKRIGSFMCVQPGA